MRQAAFAIGLLLALTGGATDAGVAEAPALPVSLEHLDALFARRDDPQALKELGAALDAALKSHGNEYAILWRASRFKYWLADGATDDRLKRRMGKESWDLGERAVKENPAGAEGHYYAAIGIGAYSQAVGILKALSEGLEGKFNEHLDRAIRLNPHLDLGGPRIAKGRYYFELPWPKRDLDKSKAELEKVLADHPENLRARLYLAETLLDDGEPEKARDQIRQVLGGDVSYDPPEGRRSQQMAKPVAQEIEEELR